MVEKWTPKPDQTEEEQIYQLSLIPTLELNSMNQTINLIKMSKAFTFEETEQHHKKENKLLKFEQLLKREFIKRIYFQREPTYAVPQYVKNYPKELSDEEKEIYEDDKIIAEAQERRKKEYESVQKSFVDMNAELKSKGLEEITEETCARLTIDKKSTGL